MDPDFFRATFLAYSDTYLAIRPKRTALGFYDQLYAYRHQHGTGSFELAHDLGCGPGKVAVDLGKSFTQVIVSDINAEHVEVARNFIGERGM